MKKNIFILLACLISGGAYAADWEYLTTSTSDTDIYVDKSFYKYDQNKKTSNIWVKAEKKNPVNGEYYVLERSLSQFSCSGKSTRDLAYAKYNEQGKVMYSDTTPEKNFATIFPDTISERLWHVACDTRGKGLKLNSRPELLSPEEVKELFPNGN